VDDINSQLMLLPKFRNHALLHDDMNEDHWSVNTPGELSELSAGIVLTAPSVVRYFSKKDIHGNRYVEFSGTDRRYFPRKIHINNIRYRNPYDEVLIDLMKSGLLYKKEAEINEPRLFEMEMQGKRDALMEAHIVHRFCSSSREAEELLDKMSADGGFDKYRFHNQDELAGKIVRIRESVGCCKPDHIDEKIQAVMNVVNNFPDEKIIVFCVYIATARYITESLRKYMPEITVETTSEKDQDELEGIITRFAPKANSIDIDDSDEEPGKVKNEIRVLVATTAMSEGFNFQDASVLVNFDLPWTVLILAQRMGRILRPWSTPRDIHIFNLMPSTMENPGIAHAFRWNNRLVQRNEDFRSFAEIPVLVEKGSEFEMVRLAQSINSFNGEDLEIDEVYQFIENAEKIQTSSFIDDLAALTEEGARSLRKLPMGIRSYKMSSIGTSALYILIRFKNSLYPAIFNESGNILYDSHQMDEIMHIIRSTEEETAAVDYYSPEKLDHWQRIACQRWGSSKGIHPDEISIYCMMVLVKR
jgi:hypothetical protein